MGNVTSARRIIPQPEPGGSKLGVGEVNIRLVLERKGIPGGTG